MAKQETLNKKYSVVAGQVEIIETSKKTMNRSELLKEKIEYMNRQQVLLNQIAELQNQHNAYNEAIASLDKMISEIDEANK